MHTIRGTLNLFIQSFAAAVPDASALRLSAALVYGWFVVNAVLCWPEHELIWGPDSVLLRYGAPSTVIQNQIYGLLYFPARFPWVFFPHVGAALLGMLDVRWAWLPRLVAWLTGLVLYYAAIPAFNSGMLLMLLLAFYAIPVYTHTNRPWRNVLNRMSRTAMILQVILCYAISSYYKLNGTHWLHGEAVYYALHVDRFTQPFVLHSQWVRSISLMAALTWGALAYQVFFPVMILWSHRKRSILLGIGVVLHLFIGAVMNLWDFALAMIFSYALFLSDRQASFFLRLSPVAYLRSRLKSS